MKRTKAQREQAEGFLAAQHAGAAAHRERLNENLVAGRVWTDERRAAWKAKAATSWTPEMRQAAAERARARHAAKAMGESQHG